MPRIAAAIGVFAAIAVFTFINIKSYPTVWNMVGASPWFTRDAQPTPQSHSGQTELAAGRLSPATPPLHPELESLSDSPSFAAVETATDAKTDATALLNADTESPLGFEPRLDPSRAPDAGLQATAAVAESPAESSPSWAAEMSPRLKYAAKPLILQANRHLNPKRPLVPVVASEKKQKIPADKPEKNRGEVGETKPPAAACKSPGSDLSGDQTIETSSQTVVRRLPPVDAADRPIRMSLPGQDRCIPIPVYPHTGR